MFALYKDPEGKLVFSKSVPSAIDDMAPSSGQGMEQLRNKISELEKRLSEVTAYIMFCFCGKHCLGSSVVCIKSCRDSIVLLQGVLVYMLYRFHSVLLICVGMYVHTCLYVLNNSDIGVNSVLDR